MKLHRILLLALALLMPGVLMGDPLPESEAPGSAGESTIASVSPSYELVSTVLPLGPDVELGPRSESYVEGNTVVHSIIIPPRLPAPLQSLGNGYIYDVREQLEDDYGVSFRGGGAAYYCPTSQLLYCRAGALSLEILQQFPWDYRGLFQGEATFTVREKGAEPAVYRFSIANGETTEISAAPDVNWSLTIVIGRWEEFTYDLDCTFPTANGPLTTRAKAAAQVGKLATVYADESRGLSLTLLLEEIPSPPKDPDWLEKKRVEIERELAWGPPLANQEIQTTLALPAMP